MNPMAPGAVARHYSLRRILAARPLVTLLQDAHRYTCVRPWGRMDLVCLEADKRHFRCVRCDGECPTLGNLTGWTLYLAPEIPVEHAAAARLSQSNEN